MSPVKKEVATVPSIWPLEIGNVLLQAERRNRLNHGDAAIAMKKLFNLSIQIDPATSTQTANVIFNLAKRHSLTTYDAAYLELAMRLGLPLATRDNALQATARQLNIECLL